MTALPTRARHVNDIHIGLAPRCETVRYSFVSAQVVDHHSARLVLDDRPYLIGALAPVMALKDALQQLGTVNHPTRSLTVTLDGKLVRFTRGS